MHVCSCFPEYFYDQEERSDEEAEPTFSEDEAVSQKGLRRSQSVKITRSRIRKDVSGLFSSGDGEKDPNKTEDKSKGQTKQFDELVCVSRLFPGSLRITED